MNINREETMAMIDFNEELWLLESPLLEVRRHAAVRLLSLTESEEELESVTEVAEFLFNSLSNHFGETKEVSEPLLRLLVELSKDLQMSSKMVTCGLVRKSMDFLYKQEAPVRGLIVNLLVSLTNHPDGVASFFQNVGEEDVEVDGEEVVAIDAAVERNKLCVFVLKLVNSFCVASKEEESYLKNLKKPDDSFENVGSLLVNIAKTGVGREFFLDPMRGLLKQIIQQYDSQSSLSKLLVSEAGDFNVKYHLLSIGYPCLCLGGDEQAVDLIFGADFVWIAVLLPLAGKKVHNELDNDTSRIPIDLFSMLMIERDLVDTPKIRIAALEVIHLLALRDAGQRALMSVNAPRILEVGYGEEVNHKVIKAYEQLRYFPLYEQLCSQLAKVESLESMRFYKKSSIVALDSLCGIVSEIDNHEEMIMQILKAKWVINYALNSLYELLESNQKAEARDLLVKVLMEHFHSRLMRFAFAGPATQVFLLLEDRYPQLMLYLQVRPVATVIQRSVQQYGEIRDLFELYAIPHRIGRR